MTSLNQLANESRPAKARKRVGRGPRSGMGKTCGRGHKGSKARSGAQRRFTYEGGQMRAFMRFPERGFSQARFRRPYHAVNLSLIDRYYQDGEVVNLESLRQRGLVSGLCHGVKILGNGRLSKKLARVEVDEISEAAREQLAAAGISLVIAESSK